MPPDNRRPPGSQDFTIHLGNRRLHPPAGIPVDVLVERLEELAGTLAGTLDDIAEQVRRVLEQMAREFRDAHRFYPDPEAEGLSRDELLDDIANDFRAVHETLKDLSQLRNMATEYRRLELKVMRFLALDGRPELDERQWFRPRRVGRACGSTHRVMLA